MHLVVYIYTCFSYSIHTCCERMEILNVWLWYTVSWENTLNAIHSMEYSSGCHYNYRSISILTFIATYNILLKQNKRSHGRHFYEYLIDKHVKPVFEWLNAYQAIAMKVYHKTCLVVFVGMLLCFLNV